MCAQATVRLLINYNTSHKTVLRVNPTLPLEALLPAVCDKCEFNVQTTVLLRDSRSEEPLDLTKSLNDHGLREVFAQDQAAKDATDHRLRTAEAGLLKEALVKMKRRFRKETPKVFKGTHFSCRNIQSSW